jgi:uncharacterized membrane protein
MAWILVFRVAELAGLWASSPRVPDHDEPARPKSTGSFGRRAASSAAPDACGTPAHARGDLDTMRVDRPGNPSMSILILGLVLFLGTHSVHMLAPAWRKRAIARIGFLPWKGLYSVVAILGLALIVIGFGMARAQSHLLYVPPAWLRHLNALFTLLAFVLVAAAYVPRNHLKAKIGHPMLAGVQLWALGHLLATGFVHDVVLFGAFLAWAVVDFATSRRRDRIAGTGYPGGTLAGDALAVMAGVAAWAIFAFLLHQRLIGVGPFI